MAYLCNGIGDHLMFLKILPEIREKHQGHKIVLGVAYPEVFAEEKDIVLLSLKDVENMGIDIDKYNIYQYCASRKWDKPFDRSLPGDVFVKIVVSPFSRQLRNGMRNAKNWPYWDQLMLRDHYFIQVGEKGEKEIGADETLVWYIFQENKTGRKRSRLMDFSR